MKVEFTKPNRLQGRTAITLLALLILGWRHVGGFTIVDSYFTTPLGSNWQLLTNNPSYPIEWEAPDSRVRLIKAGDTERAVSMILGEDIDGNPGPWDFRQFTAEFEFEIDPRESPVNADPAWKHAEGMVFFFAQIPTAFHGMPGEGLGWGSALNTFPGVAIEIDTHRDAEEDRESWSENHIGVSYLCDGLAEPTDLDHAPRSAFTVNPMDFGFPDFEGDPGGTSRPKFTVRIEWENGDFKLFLTAVLSPALTVGPHMILNGSFPHSNPIYDAFPGFSAATGALTSGIYLHRVKVDYDPTGPDPPVSSLPWAFNAGGVTTRDPYGTEWYTDRVLSPSSPMGHRAGGYEAGWGRIPVYKSNADRIYNSERFGRSTWIFNVVESGNYDVVLHWSEFATPGVQRVFNVDLQGSRVLDAFCPVRAAGGMYVATQREFSTQSFDGTLRIDLNSIDGSPIDGSPDATPKISAIEIQPTAGVPPVFPTADGDGYGVSNGYGALDTNGFIKTWLLLGPFEQLGGPNPPEVDIQEDYLAEASPSTVTEANIADGTVLVYPGMTVHTEYGGGAASVGLHPQSRSDMNSHTLNIPTWFHWVDDDCGVDFNHVYEPDVDNAVSYAVAYVRYDGRKGYPLPITVGVSSDDSVQVLVNGENVITSSVVRSWGSDDPGVQERGDAVLHWGPNNVIMVKVFEGHHDFGFRLRLEERSEEDPRPLTAADGISVHADPRETVVRIRASHEQIDWGGTVNFELLHLDTWTPTEVFWDFNACDGLHVEETGITVSHTFSAADVPKDRTFVVTACARKDQGRWTTVEKRIVVNPGLDDAADLSEWWVDEPFHLGRGLEGARIEFPSGKAIITLPRGGDYNTWNFGPGHCFDYMPKILIPVPQFSDWWIQARVTAASRDIEEENTLHGGLVAILDETGLVARPDYLKYGIYRDDIRMEESGPFEPPKDQLPTDTYGGALPYTVDLKMEKVGTQYDFYYRDPAVMTEWTHHLRCEYGEAARQIGVFAKNWRYAGGSFEFENVYFGTSVPPPLELPDYTIDPSDNTVVISWSSPPGGDPDKIRIFRDGGLIAEIPGTQTTFRDGVGDLLLPSVCPDGYRTVEYELRGFVRQAFSSTFVSVGIRNQNTQVFQDGAFPTRSYQACQDAHIARYRSWEFDDATPRLYNTGAHDYLEEGDWSGGDGDHREILIQFDLAEISSSNRVDSAELGLFYDHCRDDARINHRAYAHKVLKSWNEGRGVSVDGSEAHRNELTWRYANTPNPPTRPRGWGGVAWDVVSTDWESRCDVPPDHRGGAYGLSDIDTSEGVLSNESYGADGGRWVTWDITEYVKAWIDDPASNRGVKITQGAANDPCEHYVDGVYDFISSNHRNVALRPKLVVRFASNEGVTFRRGDCNDDGRVDISDAICILQWLFSGNTEPSCLAVTNTNGDGGADLSDAVYLLGYLFLGSPPPVAPYPDCGPGHLPADEELGCAVTAADCR